MQISVILCTCNRSEPLQAALESIAASTLRGGADWEVLVIDNHSNDRTPEVVREFEKRYPARFRYLYEDRPGKSHALNTGIRNARGEILVFVDDDVTVAQEWLENITAPFSDARWAGVGGRTLMAGAFSEPRWLALGEPYNLGGILCAVFDQGEERVELKKPPYGANMAYRKAMFGKYGNFRTDIGPSPYRDIPRPNEDAEFGRRLMAGGERICYEPSALVYHPVLENRVRKEYFLEWSFDYGRALVREWGRGPDILGIPRPYLNIISFSILGLRPRMLRWLLATDPKVRFALKCEMWKGMGVIREFYRSAQSGSRVLPPQGVHEGIAE